MFGLSGAAVHSVTAANEPRQTVGARDVTRGRHSGGRVALRG